LEKLSISVYQAHQNCLGPSDHPTNPYTLQHPRSRISRNHPEFKGYESQVSRSDTCNRVRFKGVTDLVRSVHQKSCGYGSQKIRNTRDHGAIDSGRSVRLRSHRLQLQIPRNPRSSEQSNCTRTSINTEEYQVSSYTLSLKFTLKTP
jgi:hypothetical protein